jgi:hypothetical protein
MSLPVAASQSRIVPPWSVLVKVLPSGVNAIEYTVLLGWFELGLAKAIPTKGARPGTFESR